MSDRRYEYTTCPECGQDWQMIDFRCALHRLTCDVDRIDYGTLPPATVKVDRRDGK